MDPELVRLWNPNLEVWDHQMIVISKQLNIFSGSSLGRSPSGPWKAPAKPLQNNGGNARVCLFLFFQTDSLLPKMSAGVFFFGDRFTVAENFGQSFCWRQAHCCRKFPPELHFFWETDSLLPKISARVIFFETASLLPKILARVFF